MYGGTKTEYTVLLINLTHAERLLHQEPLQQTVRFFSRIIPLAVQHSNES